MSKRKQKETGIKVADLIRGSRAFQKNEQRDAMYHVATFLIKYFWNNLYEVTNALGVLLLTWNQAFYRYGSFNFNKLESALNKWKPEINSFRTRDIFSFDEAQKMGSLLKGFSMIL